MNPSQESEFEGRGVGVPLFSSPFDRFSFATTPSSFTRLKTIVRHLRCGQWLAALAKTGFREVRLMNMV
jgi:hypothetical protein